MRRRIPSALYLALLLFTFGNAAGEPAQSFYQPVRAPAVPPIEPAGWARNPIDAFVAAERESRHLHARPEANKEILLRRVYLDLIGLSPTPAEQDAFEKDSAPDAYEKIVDRLLEDPRYGERWGRHWMDIWRYSDWAGWSGGNQIRDSQPHIWRWRDWIIESLNQDKGYDRMILEMLAADELYPDDAAALRATGFLVRNYKMLSREQWLEDTIKHTSQAFLGVTMGCAKCHDHRTEPISQKEYYQLRAIFEPHQVRTDRIPGELDIAKNGLARAYDADAKVPTYLFIRGDERHPDTNELLAAGVPKALCQGANVFRVVPVSLPHSAMVPDDREFVVEDLLEASERARDAARRELEKASAGAATEKLELSYALAEAKHQALASVLDVERFERNGQRETSEGKAAAEQTLRAQRTAALLEAKLKLLEARTAESEALKKADHAAAALKTEAAALGSLEKLKANASNARKQLDELKKKTGEAEKAVAVAEKDASGPLTAAFKPRDRKVYPETSSGRRLAFARWLVHRDNPLTARVAVNHIWLRHFGRGLVATPADFGKNGSPPSHPQLLDWLAGELMSQSWSMKAIHRLIVTSSTYRMASTSDPRDLAIDPDDIYLWRMPSRRMEAELVRDNLLFAAGDLDEKMGGPEIDHHLGLSSKRRSVYLRIAAEKEVEFLKIFDGPAVTECYQRRPSVMPQQALALANSEVALKEARRLANVLADKPEGEFVRMAYQRVLARRPGQEEEHLCQSFLNEKVKNYAKNGLVQPEARRKAAEDLAWVLFNHNDFVMIR